MRGCWRQWRGRGAASGSVCRRRATTWACRSAVCYSRRYRRPNRGFMDFAEVRRLTIAALFSDDKLFEQIVLKGGNALNLVYDLSPRTSLDLDFSMEPLNLRPRFEAQTSCPGGVVTSSPSS